MTALQSGCASTGPLRLGLAAAVEPRPADALAADARGDALDAVLCLMQAAWALERRRLGDARHGLPAQMDGLEGRIVTA